MEDGFTGQVQAASSQPQLVKLLQENALPPAAITSCHGKLSGSKSLLTKDWDLALNAVEDCIANTSHTLDTEQKILPEGVPERADLGETLEDIMESSLLSRTAWTKLFDEDGGRSVLEILLRQLDDEQ